MGLIIAGKKTTYFKGKNSNIKLIQKGYTEIVLEEDFSTITYQNFQIKTKNKKYMIMIKKFEFYYYDLEYGKYKIKPFKGNEKNSMSIKVYTDFLGLYIDKLKVYY